MSARIFYTKPSITELEIAYATDAVRHGWGEQCYSYIGRFEQALASHLGARHVIATSSCTGAMHMGLAALGIGPSDEVILGDTNWIASAAPITYLGGKPIFVDVLPDTWCLDPARVEAAITPKTKAIIAVHLYGNLANMDALLAIGKRHGLPVIEDAAEAIGSSWHGQRAGTLGVFGVFSFHGTKTMTTGEGGAFVCNDEALFERVLTLSNHGRARGQSRQFWSDMIGFKYKMSNVQAAIGCAQLERIDELIEAKRQIFASYQAQLAHMPLAMNAEPVGTINGYWMPSIVVDEGVDFDREALLERFKADQIDGRPFFWPLSMLPMFEDQPHNTVSYGLWSRAVNLPAYHDLSEPQIQRVVSCVQQSLSRSNP